LLIVGCDQGTVDGLGHVAAAIGMGRKQLVDALYVDPLMQGEGREGISAMIAAARSQFPGHDFALTGPVDEHGGNIRFSWALSIDSGEPVVRGTDFVRVDAQGRIAEVVGFLDGGAA